MKSVFAKYRDFKLRFLEHNKPPSWKDIGKCFTYFAHDLPEYEEYVTLMVKSFIEGDASDRKAILAMIDDDYIALYIGEYANKMSKMIRCSCDREYLLLGLSAVAIVGYMSDPRDVTWWLDELYVAARKARIPGKKQCFTLVASIMPDIGEGQLVSQLMSNYPAVYERNRSDEIDIT